MPDSVTCNRQIVSRLSESNSSSSIRPSCVSHLPINLWERLDIGLYLYFTWNYTGEQQNYGFIYASSVFVSYKFRPKEPTSTRAKFQRGVRKVDPNLAGSKVLFDFVVLKDFLLIVKYTVFSLWNTLSSHRERVSFHAEVHCLLIVKFCSHHERFSSHWEIHCFLLMIGCLLIVLANHKTSENSLARLVCKVD